MKKQGMNGWIKTVILILNSLVHLEGLGELLPCEVVAFLCSFVWLWGCSATLSLCLPLRHSVINMNTLKSCH